MDKSKIRIFEKILLHKWLIPPVVAFSGIVIGMIFGLFFAPGYWYSGVLGCFIASFLLGYIAYTMPKKDIVSLLCPLYAVIIFNPWSGYSTGLIMQVLYAATVFLISYRLEKRFNN
ncbi:fructose-specific phosphotransferase system IIC component [Methanomicrobium sp. W14]|uniref:hypothetical protein n=1 Tax=Methanomicrobium sp. W14 TaxID=2817839 RepID=UPI001AE6E1DE|nr:hypothetical protein [Methanomicrobium sp. W14]MBP2132171.1 fructose-specific phosphotransferase system IIC component [Methanomicrobium sp. W14]